MRHVICHYHIYKNSGTSFDEILKANYGELHVGFDGPYPYFTIGQGELAKIIQRNPAAKSFSSHQISLPPPCSLDFTAHPVVFVRHPILRIYSVYKYKREENDGTQTSIDAQAMDFAQWCRHGLEHPQEIAQVSNVQTRMLGGTYGNASLIRRGKRGMEYDLVQARRNIAGVELLARTEHFQDDVGRFAPILKRYGIAFECAGAAAHNVTASDLSLSVEQRLALIAEELGDEMFNRLLTANRQDLVLYDDARQLIER